MSTPTSKPLPMCEPITNDHPAVVLMLPGGYDLDRIVRDHRPDDQGWCRGCGGPETGHRMASPCLIELFADRAVLIRDHPDVARVRRQAAAAARR